MMKSMFYKHLRIMWAITLKDLIDAVKNKHIISIIISALFVVVIYKYLPGLTAEEGPPKLLIYYPTNSTFLSALYDSPAIDLYVYESESDMKYYLTNGEVPELGLTIPENFDPTQNTNSPIQLEGYVLHLFKDDEVHELKRFMEGEFEYLLGRPVNISIEKIHFQPETHGMTVLTSLGFAFVTIMVGMTVVPHMMIEEKQTKTIDALMISPASPSHIVISKAIAGLIYTFLMLIIAVAFNWILIQQRWLFILGGLLGGLFAISLGMMLGILIDSRQQLTLWAWVGFIPLFLPMMLSLMDDLFPEHIIKILQWFPSSAMFRIFRTSMARNAPLNYFGPQLAILIASSTVFLFIDSWLIHRLDR
jgi:ABC-2 type transport system permease protein